jgi:diguanylate cyclase (GGDEF)-like protein/PAS domain S-box-containing protein
VLGAAGVIVAMAVVVSSATAGRLRETATDAARHSVESIVRGFIDPALEAGSFDLGSRPAARVDEQLERLSLANSIRLINIWSRDGRVVYSSDPALRDRRFSIGSDLARAFGGETVAAYEGAGGSLLAGITLALPPRFLEVFVPIRGTTDGNPFAVYEVYQDATGIEDQVEGTRRDVFVTALAAATSLLALLWLAFAAASRRLARQNRLLRDRAATERLLATNLRRSEERFRSLVRNSSDIILILRGDGTIAYESPAVESVLGYPMEARVNREPFEIVHPDDLSRARYLVQDVLGTAGAEASAEFRVRHADGSWRTMQAVAKNLLDDPAVAGIVVNYRNVTDRRALEEQLRHQAFHDSLTGLANRALFNDRLEHALTRRASDRGPLAVLFIDLDDFKAVNDTLGHGAGDRLLVDVASRIRGSLRPVDTAARMGGDEFAILVEDVAGSGSAREVAERVLTAVSEPTHRGLGVRVSASVGMVYSDEATATAEELLRNADVAMYLAKSQGKGRVVEYERERGDVAVARLQLRADLHQAADTDAFALAYQPIVELATGDVRGFEALLRWSHPTRGPIGPAEFVPLAEESGLIVDLGRQVLHWACATAVTWPAGPQGPLGVSVNLSGRQLERPDLASDVAAALAASGLEPSLLTLEITESVLMADVTETAAMLGRLRALGVRLAIDDFGTGYSSLSYLRAFPVDTLKIDRSFVAALCHGRRESAVVNSIVALARSLHLGTVAEGIESPAQLAELRALGATLGQGYLFERPLLPGAVPGFMERQVAAVALRTAASLERPGPTRREMVTAAQAVGVGAGDKP